MNFFYFIIIILIPIIIYLNNLLIYLGLFTKYISYNFSQRQYITCSEIPKDISRGKFVFQPNLFIPYFKNVSTIYSELFFLPFPKYYYSNKLQISKTSLNFRRLKFKKNLINIFQNPINYSNLYSQNSFRLNLNKSKNIENSDSINESSWETLYNGNILKQIQKKGEGTQLATPSHNITIEFNISRLNNKILFSNIDLEISMLEFPLIGANSGMKAALMSMVHLEKSKFLVSPEAHKLNGTFIGKEFVKDDEWLKFDIEMCNLLYWNESYGGFDQKISSSLLPKEEPSDLSKEEEVELKSDLIMKQVENSMAHDMNSQYWEDISSNLTSSHYSSIDEHIRKTNKNINEESKISPSRDYLENLVKKGSLHGYSLGDKMEGKSKNYVWRETPFTIELIFPIDDQILSKQVECTIDNLKFKISLLGEIVFEDEFLGPVYTDNYAFWIINRPVKNSSFSNNNNSHKISNEKDNLDFSQLKEIQSEDSFNSMQNYTNISVFLYKKNRIELWGTIFKIL